jgi:hypothetical protein
MKSESTISSKRYTDPYSTHSEEVDTLCTLVWSTEKWNMVNSKKVQNF